MSSIIHLEPKVDKTIHRIDVELITKSKDEMKVWVYLMTQYNLKPGLRKFYTRGATAALDELTQLHMMDTWMAIDLSKLKQEDQIKALSSLSFLKEKQTGKIKGKACINGVSKHKTPIYLLVSPGRYSGPVSSTLEILITPPY